MSTSEETHSAEDSPGRRFIFKRGWAISVVALALIVMAVVVPLLQDPDVVGTYVLDAPQASVVLTLEKDGIARVQAPGSPELTGGWDVQGDQLVVEAPEGNEQLFQIREDALIDPNGQRWVKTDDPPEVANEGPISNPALDEMDSALKNAATAMESYAVENQGNYSAAELRDLQVQGLQLAPEISLTIDSRRTAYCIQAEHAALPGVVRHYDSNVGAPEDGPC